MFDPALGRFFTQDRFAEKYLDFSPYQYAANNPMLYIDVNGDSIYVAKEHREALNKDLTNAFGDKSSNFSYTESGKVRKILKETNVRPLKVLIRFCHQRIMLI